MTGICSRIRSLLDEAPATSGELAALLRVSAREAVIGIWCLKQMGHIRTTGYLPRPGPKGGKNPAIYELTPHGRFMLKEKNVAESRSHGQ